MQVDYLYNGQYGVTSDSNGLYYMRARYYNIDIKRFINQDILTGSIDSSKSLNRYAYVEGNPISYLDPFGLKKADTEFLHLIIATGQAIAQGLALGFLLTGNLPMYELFSTISDIFSYSYIALDIADIFGAEDSKAREEAFRTFLHDLGCLFISNWLTAMGKIEGLDMNLNVIPKEPMRKNTSIASFLFTIFQHIVAVVQEE